MSIQSRSSRFVLLVGIFLVFAIALMSSAAIWVAYRQSVEEWRNQMSNLSLILSEQSAQEVTSAYLILNSIAESVQAADIKSSDELRQKMSTPEVHASMRDKTRGLPQIDVATIVAANGDVVNFTRSHPAPKISLADRDYFAEHVRDPKLGVYISKPVRNKGNGQWTFYLSRRLSGPHGEFIGLALVGFSSTFLSDFYKKISLGAGATVTLYRRDFTVLARWPHNDALMGQVNRSGSTFQVIEQMHQNEGVVVTDAPRQSQGGAAVARMGAVRLIDKYPLIINITVTADAYLAQWHQFVLVIGLISGASVAAIVLAFALLIKSLKRRELDMTVTERLKTEAEAASHAKSEFLTMMSHEIRTPLTSIIGFAELIDSSSDASVRNDAGQVILRNGQHLLHIINDILDISKIEAGRLLLEQLVFSPLEVAAGVEAMMRSQAESKGIVFELAVDYPMPDQVLGDPTRWKQILFNLCSNAIKFTELGSVRMHLSYERTQSMLLCRVRDTGIGISAEQLARLFTPFSQADSAITRKYGGTGLGLHLVQQLAHKMGGRVDVTSTVGVGSEFSASISAPLAATTLWLASAPAALVQPVAPLRPGAARLRGRVLLAEDGPDNRKLICAFLSRTGLEFEVAENGQQAVEQALVGQFDLILMDIQMPVMDGVAATTTLRAAGFEAPIIALTANVMAEDVQRYLACGCTHCVGKPIDFGQLSHLLSELLDGADAAPELPFETDELDGFAELKRSFEDSLPERIAHIGAALNAADWDNAKGLVHSLKGTAGSFGYPGVTEVARTLDLALREGDHAQTEKIFKELTMLEEVLALQLGEARS